MTDISLFFAPVELDLSIYKEDQLGSTIHSHIDGRFPDIEKPGVAIIFAPEYRNSSYINPTISDDFRKALYGLYRGTGWSRSIYDLGTIKPGHDINDTYHAIANVCHELMLKKVIPIVIGGSQDITFAIYKAYEKLEQLINLCSIDCKLDLGDTNNQIAHDAWLNKIILHKPCYLFNYANIGAQTHYISPKETELFEKLYFDILRFGQISHEIELAEPILRNTDLLSLDLMSIRSSDLSGKHYAQPNGLNAQEICRLSRYAGISDKITSYGITNYFPEEISEASNMLVGQVIWYFIEGVENRKGDFPIGSKKTYTKYIVALQEENTELVFLKSDKSGRWWMEVPYPSTKNLRYERHTLVPCTYKDYQQSMEGMIPDLWWKTFQKLG